VDNTSLFDYVHAILGITALVLFVVATKTRMKIHHSLAYTAIGILIIALVLGILMFLGIIG
jgi:hypothetical protein